MPKIEVWREALKNNKNVQSSRYFMEHDLINDPAFKRGIKMVKDIINCCLNLVATVFTFTPLQFKLFKGQLTCAIPFLFGIQFFLAHRKLILKLLGLKNHKLLYIFIGSRRDGKSIVLCSMIVAMCCVLDEEMKLIQDCMPLCGPKEKNGITFLGILERIFSIPAIREKYPYIRFSRSQKTGSVKNLNNDLEYSLSPITNTDGGFRGKTFYYQPVDEFLFFEPSDWYTYFLPRFKQDGIAAVMITTPNSEETAFDIYHETTIKFTVDDCSRICRSCIDKMKNNNPKYKDMDMAEKVCIRKKHREPITAFWQESAKDQSGWSIYMPNHIYAQEFAGISMSLSNQQFSDATLKMFFSQRAQAPSFYERIDFCIDNADSGKSFCAMSAWISWLCHMHLLSATDFRLGQAEYSEQHFFNYIEKILTRCNKKYSEEKTRIYVWVECNTGHIGTKLSNILKYMKNVYVMCGRKADTSIETRELVEGVYKGPGVAEKYVSTFQEGLIKNWIKISQDFITPIQDQEKDTLAKLHCQLKNYVKNEKGKLTGKDGGKEDDLCIATIMGPEWIRASNERGSIYNKQLYGNRGGRLVR